MVLKSFKMDAFWVIDSCKYRNITIFYRFCSTFFENGALFLKSIIQALHLKLYVLVVVVFQTVA